MCINTDSSRSADQRIFEDAVAQLPLQALTRKYLVAAGDVQAAWAVYMERPSTED
jgi:hypothetical protein